MLSFFERFVCRVSPLKTLWETTSDIKFNGDTPILFICERYKEKVFQLQFFIRKFLET